MEATWNALAAGEDILSATMLHNASVAWHHPLDGKVHAMLRALKTADEWISPDRHHPGELWLRWGMDGVPIWSAQARWIELKKFTFRLIASTTSP